MKYDLYLSPLAKKQYKKFDGHIKHNIRTELLNLEKEPYEKGNLLQGFNRGLRYIKIFHTGVQYRAVYDIAKDKQEILVISIGSRENFYKELRRFLI